MAYVGVEHDNASRLAGERTSRRFLNRITIHIDQADAHITPLAPGSDSARMRTRNTHEEGNNAMNLVFAAISIEVAREAAKAINAHMATWPDNPYGAQEAVEKLRRARVVGLKAFYGAQDRVLWAPDFNEMLSIAFVFEIEYGRARLFADASFAEDELFPGNTAQREPVAQKAGRYDD